MNGTRYANPHGLPDEKQVTTARDMAILARAIMHDFPEYELYFRIPALQLGKRIIRNHNRLIDHYPGADGMKTGFICSSGFNMVAGATRNGKRLIVVVFGSYSASQRTEDAARLFERGFRRDVTLLPDSHYALLENVSNQAGSPEDLREQMCNAKRKRPAAESDIDDDDEDDDVLQPAKRRNEGRAKSEASQAEVFSSTSRHRCADSRLHRTGIEASGNESRYRIDEGKNGEAGKGAVAHRRRAM